MPGRSIAEWQKASFELARKRGEHDQRCTGAAELHTCVSTCCDGPPDFTGAAVDHKSPTRIASRLALIHLSISRAVECAAKGEMGVYWVDPRTLEQHVLKAAKAPLSFEPQGWKPIGFPIALADVFLRLCELAEGLGVELRHVDRKFAAPCSLCAEPEELLSELAALHERVSCCKYACDGSSLSGVLRKLWTLAARADVDLLAMAELKYAYEASE